MPWRILKKHEVDQCKVGETVACSNSLVSFTGEVDWAIPDKGIWVSGYNGRHFADPDYFQIKKWEEPVPPVN